MKLGGAVGVKTRLNNLKSERWGSATSLVQTALLERAAMKGTQN